MTKDLLTWFTGIVHQSFVSLQEDGPSHAWPIHGEAFTLKTRTTLLNVRQNTVLLWLP